MLLLYSWYIIVHHMLWLRYQQNLQLAAHQEHMQMAHGPSVEQSQIFTSIENLI